MKNLLLVKTRKIMIVSFKRKQCRNHFLEFLFVNLSDVLFKFIHALIL